MGAIRTVRLAEFDSGSVRQRDRELSCQQLSCWWQCGEVAAQKRPAIRKRFNIVGFKRSVPLKITRLQQENFIFESFTVKN